MPNTFNQIHIHIVFAVRFRRCLIHAKWKERLHQYITGIVRNNDHKLLAINSVPDHVHMLIGLRPHQSLADLLRIVKGESSEWINKEHLTTTLFRWQEGYGAFSYARSQLGIVIKYIENQEEHHRNITFLSEYKALLAEFAIEYDEKYIFHLPE